MDGEGFWHPWVVHLPVAFGLFAPLIPILGRALNRRWVGALYFFCFSVAIYAAMYTGERDYDAAIPSQNRAALADYVEEHEKSAQLLLVSTLVTLVIHLAAMKRKERLWFWLCCVAAVGLLGLTINTARLGGGLVYEHGAPFPLYQGMPETQSPATTRY